MPDKKTILVVEDDRTSLVMLKNSLTKKGYEIIEASDGDQAYQITKRTSPDLVILDMKMPKMGGMSFYQCITRADGTPRFPVIVVTGSPGELNLHEGFTFKEVIAKPINVDQVLASVERVFTQA